jgi:DNA primase
MPHRETEEEKRQAPAAPHERELLEILLAEPGLVARAAAEIKREEVQHPGLRQLLELMYLTYAAGETPDLDLLRPQIENPRLAEYALRMRDDGQRKPNRAASLQGLLAVFRQRRELPRKQELQNQLHAAQDHSAALELLRQLQNQSVSLEPGTPVNSGPRP